MYIWQVKLGIAALFIALWLAGGQIKGRIRDIPCPILLGLGIALFSHLQPFWRAIMGIASIGTANSIRLGYGAYDPINDTKPSPLATFTHDRQGFVIRAIWGFIVSLLISAPLAAFGVISLPAALLYIGSNCIINFSVSKFRFNVWLTDILVSAAVMSIIFYI